MKAPMSVRHTCPPPSTVGGRGDLLRREADGERPIVRRSRRFHRVGHSGRQRQRDGVAVVPRRGDVGAVVHQLAVVAAHLCDSADS